MDPRHDQEQLLAKARALGQDQGGVVSRPQLYEAGVPRWLVARELRVGRWQRLSDQAVCVHNGPVAEEGHWWAAVLQGGPRAQLDGASALLAAGLQRFTVARVRVTVPRGARIRRNPRYDIRQSRRWQRDDVAPSGIPRTRPAVAAVRGALWARTDREATYLLTAAVQQGLVSHTALGAEILRIRRDRRRALLHAVVNDLLDGARSLGELDIVHELERRGLPRPEKQVLRRDHRGRYYLDLSWPHFRVVLEIDGIHHSWAENVVGDALRQNALSLQGDTVLRLPLLGYRLEPDEFFAQVRAALVAAGWSARAA
jgi:hypothetical protein